MVGFRFSWSIAGMLGVVVAHVPREADACGGTFCDGAGDPTTMPVDQTGENIFFVVADGEVEAHIQIQYDGTTEAMQFAWIVPVMATPSFEVGAQQLFINLANATVPSYGWVGFDEPCDDGFDDGGFDGGSCSDPSGGGADTTGGGEGGEDGGTTGGGTTVVLQDTVGAFDAVVLEATTSADLMMWLASNGYYADPVAEPILQEYIDEGAQFAAFRLSQSAGIGELHPVVIRYTGDEPCIPIRLTRIAAQDDMDIRAFFLGDARVVPTNYQHVELNPVKLDWIALGANYKEVVTLAVDEPMADGHAFVTEYAGASGIVSQEGLFSEDWNAAAFAALDPTAVVGTLQAQGLMGACDDTMCEFVHPLVRGLLVAYLPPPDGLSEGEFWGNVAMYQDMVDVDAWDAAQFSAAIQERIIDPGAHAVELLDTYPTLTRMYTTMSPHEMTEDPMFHTNLEVPDVDNTSRIATFFASCGGGELEMQSIGLDVDVQVQSLTEWPDIAPEQMPWAMRIEVVPPSGAPMVLVDNQMSIEMLVDAWNQSASERGPQASCHDESGTSPTDDDDGDDDGDDDTSTGTSGGSGDQTGNGADGCGCTADDRGSLALLGLFAAPLLRRRRRDVASPAR
jgi:MYXO-CTERM domain-containing protein